MKFVRTLGIVAGLGALLGGCDQVNAASDKASACSTALGLANLNPNIDPAKMAQEAGDKADQLRQLATQVADQDLKQNLITLADSYVDLEKRKVNELGNLSDWIQRNATNLDHLRKSCL